MAALWRATERCGGGGSLRRESGRRESGWKGVLDPGGRVALATRVAGLLRLGGRTRLYLGPLGGPSDDGLLAEAGSGVATLGIPGSAGVPASAAAQTIVLPFNNGSALTLAFAQR